MQTGIVQPSGPSSHFWISFGSVWARYTASGGAVNRLVTMMWVSPSIFSVSLLIAFLLFLSSEAPWRPEHRPDGRSSCPKLCAAWPAIDPSLPDRPWQAGGGASYPRHGGRRDRRLRALSGAAKPQVASF